MSLIFHLLSTVWSEGYLSISVPRLSPRPVSNPPNGHDTLFTLAYAYAARCDRSKHIHILFFIAFERHTSYLLASDLHDGVEPLVMETIYALHSVTSHVNKASALANAIPCGQQTRDLLEYPDSGMHKCVVAASKKFMTERLEPFGGMAWGLILTPKSETEGGYEIEEGGWRILSWLVEVWLKDEEQCQEGEFVSRIRSPDRAEPTCRSRSCRGVANASSATWPDLVSHVPDDRPPIDAPRRRIWRRISLHRR